MSEVSPSFGSAELCSLKIYCYEKPSCVHAVEVGGDALNSSDVLVIGAGFGGIGAALRMRAKGYSVTLVDRLQAIGGRAQVFERGGFRHDGGPTVITAPFLFDELFALFGERLEDHLEFRPLDPWYRFRFHDGQQFDYRPSIEDTNAEMRRFNVDDVDGYAGLLKTSRQVFEIGFEKLFDQPFTRFWTMMAQVPSLLRLLSYQTVAGIVNSHIRHPLLRQAFSIHPLLVGGNPLPQLQFIVLYITWNADGACFSAWVVRGGLWNSCTDCERAGVGGFEYGYRGNNYKGMLRNRGEGRRWAGVFCWPGDLQWRSANGLCADAANR